MSRSRTAWMSCSSVEAGTAPGREYTRMPSRKGHQGWDRPNLRRRRQLLLRLGVHLPEGDVRVLLARGVEHRREHPTRTAPAGPPVHERDAVTNGVLERLLGQINGCHRYSPVYPGGYMDERASASSCSGEARTCRVCSLLIGNQRQLRSVLPEYPAHYTEHRLHRSGDQRPPLAVSEPSTRTNRSVPLFSAKPRSACSDTNTAVPLDVEARTWTNQGSLAPIQGY